MVVLDKTGTLTAGEMTLVEVARAAGVRRGEVLRMADALEDGFAHPDRPGDRPGGARGAGHAPGARALCQPRRASASRASVAAAASSSGGRRSRRPGGRHHPGQPRLGLRKQRRRAALAALGHLNPLVAGAAMALSSAFVVASSLRLRGFRPVSAGG
jgi:magnesium-transporting ATPase (P-type)